MTRSLRHSGFWLFLSGVLMLSISSPTLARDEFAVTLRSARAVRDAFEKTTPVSNAAGTLKVPAIVSEKLFARFFSISKNQYPNGNDAAWVKQHFALGREGIGRYFIFVADHSLIEKALIAGQFNPDQIMADVGYGTGATCSANQNYWLVVFRPKSQPVSAVYPHNLQKWFDHVYGTARSPKISPSVVADLMSKRFSDLTECPLDSTTGAFRWSDLTQCDPIFTSIANALNQKQCANKVALRYSPTNQCPTDRVLHDLGPKPSAIELRAWLFAVNSFSEYFTGNGYSGDSYDAPANREYWVDNQWLRNLPEIELLKVHCQSKAYSSDGIMLKRQSTSWPERRPASFVEEYGPNP